MRLVGSTISPFCIDNKTYDYSWFIHLPCSGFPSTISVESSLVYKLNQKCNTTPSLFIIYFHLPIYSCLPYLCSYLVVLLSSSHLLFCSRSLLNISYLPLFHLPIYVVLVYYSHSLSSPPFTLPLHSISYFHSIFTFLISPPLDAFHLPLFVINDKGI